MTRDKTQFPKGAQESGPASIPLSLEFDAAEFAHFLHETGWSDDQKAEYVTLIWNVVCEFVALGWNVHPVQQARNACGKPQESDAETAPSKGRVVDSSYGDLAEKFMRLSGSNSLLGAGGVIDEQPSAN